MKALYVRKGSSIKNLATGENKEYNTINAAKKASANIQKENGGLGQGSVQMEFHKNQRRSIEAWLQQTGRHKK